MAKFEAFNLLKYGVISVISTIIVFFVGMIFRVLNIPAIYYDGGFYSVTASVLDINIREQVISMSIFQKIGEGIIDFMKGTLMLDITKIIAIFFGIYGVLILGRIIVGFMKQTKFLLKTRVWVSFIIGAAILGIFFLPIWISVLVYAFVLGGIMQLLVNLKSLRWVSE